MNEFSLIQRLLAQSDTPDSSCCVVGPGDDAAICRVPDGQQLVSSMDTLNAGVHFPVDLAAADLGWRSLAVNISDLAAMGADPAWFLLSLSIPEPDKLWLEGFANGLGECARRYGLMLAGGDTTRGPLSISVQISGLVPEGQGLLRSGAGPGDLVYVSGVTGLAAAGLQLWQQGRAGERARQRFLRPVPRMELGRALRGLASSAIDVSDGLLQDLGHLLEANDCGVRLDLQSLGTDVDLTAAVGASQARALALGGGDDYELCFTVAREHAPEVDALSQRLQLPVTMIGHIVADRGMYEADGAGGYQPLEPVGYQHFRSISL